MCFHSCLVSALFTGPSLLVVNSYRVFLSQVVFLLLLGSKLIAVCECIHTPYLCLSLPLSPPSSLPPSLPASVSPSVSLSLLSEVLPYFLILTVVLRMTSQHHVHTCISLVEWQEMKGGSGKQRLCLTFSWRLKFYRVSTDPEKRIYHTHFQSLFVP